MSLDFSKCVSCGRIVSKKDKFCGNCGIKMDPYNSTAQSVIPSATGVEIHVSPTIAPTADPEHTSDINRKYSTISIAYASVAALILLLIIGGGIWYFSKSIDSDSNRSKASVFQNESADSPKTEYEKYLNDNDTHATDNGSGMSSKKDMLKDHGRTSSEFYRIRNRWKPDQYIHIEHGSTQSSPIEMGWHSAQWTLEYVFKD